MKAILRFAPIFDARMIDDPKLGREIMVQRGAFTTMKSDGEIPVVVDHDLSRVVGRVTHLRSDDYVHGGVDWWAAHADITDPPGWLKRHGGVSWSCFPLQEQDVNGTRRLLRGILEEISLLSPSQKPAEDAARELPELPLEDALQLVHLYAERGSLKYERAALRWLGRYLTEGSPRLQHFVEITTEFGPAGAGRERAELGFRRLFRLEACGRLARARA